VRYVDRVEVEEAVGDRNVAEDELGGGLHLVASSNIGIDGAAIHSLDVDITLSIGRRILILRRKDDHIVVAIRDGDVVVGIAHDGGEEPSIVRDTASGGFDEIRTRIGRAVREKDGILHGSRRRKGKRRQGEDIKGIRCRKLHSKRE